MSRPHSNQSHAATFNYFFQHLLSSSKKNNAISTDARFSVFLRKSDKKKFRKKQTIMRIRNSHNNSNVL
jgi:hypothetical protein